MPPGLTSGFQSFVNKELPPGVAGDFAGANIRANIIASPWGFVASPGGVNVGVGGWANPATGIASQYYQPSSFAGFVHREGQAIITTFLGVASMLIVGGDPVTLMDQGEFWGLFNSGATPGQKVYFNPQTGALTAAASGGTVGGTITTASIAAGNPAVMTVTTITGTPLTVGTVITGVGVPPGTYIASFGTGSGGAGTYNLANVDGTTIPTVASGLSYAGIQETNYYVASVVTADATFTASLAQPAAGTAYGILTVTAVAAGVLVPGQYLSATGGGGLPASANTVILQQLTGTTGNTGTYLTTNVSYTVTSTNTFVGTQGKLGKISSWTTPLT